MRVDSLCQSWKVIVIGSIPECEVLFGEALVITALLGRHRTLTWNVALNCSAVSRLTSEVGSFAGTTSSIRCSVSAPTTFRERAAPS